MELVKSEDKVIAAITDIVPYLKARELADELSEKYGLMVADMPMLIRTIYDYPEVWSTIRPYFIDVVSGAYRGFREGNLSYEVWHSVGSLSTAKGLGELFTKIKSYDMPTQIPDDEWVSVGKGSYNGQSIVRVESLEDLRKGDVPSAGTPFTVALRVPDDYELVPADALFKDVLQAHKRGELIIFEDVWLNRDKFMLDDRVAAICGGPENVALLYKLLFGRRKDGGEGKNVFPIGAMLNDCFDNKVKGNLVSLYGEFYHGNLGGWSDHPILGRFVGVQKNE